MSLKATLPQGKMFRDIIDSLKENLTDATFICSPEGLRLSNMDSAHVSLVSLVMPSALFYEYSCTSEFPFSISLVTLFKIVKSMTNDSSNITISTSATFDVLKLVAVNINTGNTEAEYEIPLMCIDSEELNIPSHLHEAQVKIPSSIVKAHLTTLEQFGDVITILVDHEKIGFRTKGDSGAGSYWCFNKEAECDITMAAGATLVANPFSVFYLKKFSKSAVLSEKMIIRTSNGRPLEFVFKIGKNANRLDNGSITYYLAPKEMDGEAV